MNRNVVFGGFWKRLEVLGTLLELPSKLGGSGGAEPPQVIGVRIEMSSSYAVCCMLHAVCCMLYAVLYAVCCILHAILKALGDARIIPTFVKNLLKMGSKISPKWGPEGPRRVLGASGSPSGRPCCFRIDFSLILGSILGSLWSHVGLKNR